MWHLFNQLLYGLKYLRYLLLSSQWGGHGVHSPFVFKLVQNVWKEKIFQEDLRLINSLYAMLTRDHSLIACGRAGAGSHVSDSKMRKVSSLAKSSGIPVRYGKLMYRTVSFLQPGTIVEFGTSLGFSTAWMAKGNKKAQLYTVEAVKALAERAEINFKVLKINNVTVINNDFKSFMHTFSLPQSGDTFVFIDGDHKQEATLDMVGWCIKALLSDNLVIVIDDIHWSKGMEKAWKKIQNFEEVKVTIDIFRMGMVFFNKSLSKQNFVIKY